MPIVRRVDGAQNTCRIDIVERVEPRHLSGVDNPRILPTGQNRILDVVDPIHMRGTGGHS